MRVSRLRATNFRGWSQLDLKRSGDVVIVGEPRAGRTDLIAALTRVLDPRSTRLSPNMSDIHQHLASEVQAATFADAGSVPETAQGADASAGAATMSMSIERAAFAEVELTLRELGSDIEQEVPGVLEPTTADGEVDDSGHAGPTAPLGLRLTYRVAYDAAADALTHVLYFPALSNPDSEQFARVPSSLRLMLPVVFLDAARPLQLRAEGLLRRLLTERDPDAVSTALRALESQIVDAAGALSKTAVLAGLLNAILSDAGPARRVGDRPLTADDVQFLPDDGSLAGILRALQPLLSLDQAGHLALTSHGSTTTAAIGASEALILAKSTQGAVIIGDDFGEGLDGPSAEHLAAAMKASGGQVWLTTRRAEVARTFDVSEIVRLTRRGGARSVHGVPTPADKKEVAAQRHLQTQLLPALTVRTVGIVEGRHDLTTYTAADRLAKPPALPLAGHGIQLISADSGDGGGTSQIPRVAALAKALGFRVVGLIDRDPAKNSEDVLQSIEDACDAVVRLPESMAIERALLAGADPTDLRTAAAVMPSFGQQDPTVGEAEDELPEVLRRALHKNGLHEAFMAALVAESSKLPPVIRDALDHVAMLGDLDYSGAKRIDLTFSTQPKA
jgi:putative ATP-dependent endonuclease of OLD family